jgi:hypothetical protein
MSPSTASNVGCSLPPVPSLGGVKGGVTSPRSLLNAMDEPGMSDLRDMMDTG